LHRYLKDKILVVVSEQKEDTHNTGDAYIRPAWKRHKEKGGSVEI
jgi:hypothetical protein